jgi:Ca-activated chloride channel homolog
MGLVIRPKNVSPSLALRLVALAVVLAAPLLPPASREGKQRSVMLVVDRSESMGPSASAAAAEVVREVWDRRGSTRVGLVAVDGAAELVRPISEATASAPLPPIGPRASGGTDLAAGVRLAVAALPDGGERRIVLLTDGRATRGDALAEVRRARALGIEVDTVPFGGRPEGPTAVAAVRPREARLADGEPAKLTADLRGVAGETVTVAWLRDRKPLRTDRVTLDMAGVGTSTIDDPRPGPGAHVYEAYVDGAPHARRASAAIDVSGKPRALVVTVDGECPAVLCDALDKAEIARSVVPLGERALDPAALSGADLVVLADVPLAPAGAASDMGLGPLAQEALIAFAQKGGGVLVTGGAFGFAPEYADAPIARMLPVEVENQGQVEDPRVAMAIMLDRSGSMCARVGSHTKLQLAVEAGLAAASTLRPDDSLALGSVDTKTTWNHPFGSVAGLNARREEIRSMSCGGGGIYVYTSLVDAYAVLRKANAPLRHVIVFSDTADSEEQAENCSYGTCPGIENTAEKLADTARRAGITTSIVGIGRESDSDTAFLRRLAAAGSGRFYLTSNATDLRRIFVSETRVATRSNLRAGPIAVDVAEDHPILAGVDVSAFPPLGGFVDAKRRATADTALVTHDDKKPILASWRYGLGKVVALTTDLRADWKNGWSTFGQAGQVLRQAVRFAMRRRGAGAADVRVATRAGTAEITVEVADDADGAAAAPTAIEIVALGPEGGSAPVTAPLERVAPGRFVARAPVGDQPFVVARARDAAGGFVGEAVGRADGGDELGAEGPDARALRALADEGGGRFAPAATEVLRRGGPRGREPIPLWPWALLGAALLVCVDLWLRRLGRARRTALVPVARAEKPAPPSAGAPAEAPIAQAA